MRLEKPRRKKRKRLRKRRLGRVPSLLSLLLENHLLDQNHL
jgi:hypothetical protein